MSTLDKYIEELKNQGEGGLNKKKEALKETAESDKKTINAYADDSLQSIRDGYNADVADAHESYEDAFRKNEVQVKLNERYLERKAAEMGLTDSGLNRTQMTANQLSYANQKGELTAQKQKAIDTLAAAMRANITEVNTKRNDALAAVDSTLKKDIAQADMDFNKSIRDTAAEMVNAQYKADKEAETKQNSDWLTRYDSFLTNIIDEDISPEKKKNIIEIFADTYGFESIEQANAALKYAGLNEYYSYDKNGKLQRTNENFEYPNKAKTYTIRKTEDTVNGFLGIKGLFGGIDSNDTYEIIDDSTDEVIKTIKNIDDFTSLTSKQKKKLSNLKDEEELSTEEFEFSDDGLKRFIESIS